MVSSSSRRQFMSTDRDEASSFASVTFSRSSRHTIPKSRTVRKSEKLEITHMRLNLIRFASVDLISILALSSTRALVTR